MIVVIVVARIITIISTINKKKISAIYCNFYCCVCKCAKTKYTKLCWFVYMGCMHILLYLDKLCI